MLLIFPLAFRNLLLNLAFTWLTQVLSLYDTAMSTILSYNFVSGQ